jgi:hypothetical protein
MGPPPPPKSNTGLVIALAVGGGALVMVCGLVLVVGLFVHTLTTARHQQAEIAASLSPSIDGTDDGSTDGDGDSPTSSPSPTSRAASTLDSATTDDTPLTAAQVFAERTVEADDGTSYELVASGFFSGCDDVGGDDTEALMRAHGCGNMLTGDYSNDSVGLLISVMVVPLPSAGDATAVVDTLDQLGDPFDELHYYCPQNVSYHDTLCGAGATPPTWSEISVAFHRYAILCTALEESGADTPHTDQVKSAVNGVAYAIEDAIPVVR